jgi:hypothetical protein
VEKNQVIPENIYKEQMNQGDLCFWKETYERNKGGDGTSFTHEMNNPYFPCGECKGYEKDCKTGKYLSSEGME